MPSFGISPDRLVAERLAAPARKHHVRRYGGGRVDAKPPRLLQDLNRSAAQRYTVLACGLHPRGRNRPNHRIQVDLLPCRQPHLSRTFAERVAVSTRNSKASFTPAQAVEAHTAATAPATSPCGSARRCSVGTGRFGNAAAIARRRSRPTSTRFSDGGAWMRGTSRPSCR